jgi:hypothetical protein
MGEGAGGRWGARGPFFDTPKFFDIPKLASWRWAQTLEPPSRGPCQASAPGRFLTVAGHRMRASQRAADARTTPWRAWRMGLGGWSREIGRISTKSLKWRFRPKKVAHFVWEKPRARTTYIVKECPRKTFCTL